MGMYGQPTKPQTEDSPPRTLRKTVPAQAILDPKEREYSYCVYQQIAGEQFHRIILASRPIDHTRGYRT